MPSPRIAAALAALLLAAPLPGDAAAQEAAASPAPQQPASGPDAEAAPEPAVPEATRGLADDEAPARGEMTVEGSDEVSAGEAEDGAVRTAVPLRPDADTWREDPTVILSAVDVDLDDFLWAARPVVVFADTEADPAFQQQIKYLTARMDALVGRDVVVLTDTDPDALSDLRRKLRPRGFMLAILGKDGGVKMRKPFPWDVREITHAIDKFPLRKQELRDAREPNL